MKDLFFFGGDKRMQYAAEYVKNCGISVKTFFTAADIENIEKNNDFSLVYGAVLPLPCEKGGFVFSDDKSFLLPVRNLLKFLPEGSLLLGGNISDFVLNEADKKNMHAIDYFRREDLAVLNAELTSEACIKRIIDISPISLCDSKILIVGFGRIGKMLAKQLSAFTSVCVSARSFKDFAQLKSLGYSHINTYKLAENAALFDVIINTVPNPVITKSVLENTKKDAIIIDLASNSGGCDKEFAAEYGITIYHELSLPGRVFPKSAGRAVGSAIMNILLDLKSQ